MKYLILLLLVIPKGVSYAGTHSLDIGKPDRQLHAAVSFASTVALTQVFKKSLKQPEVAAIVTTLFFGACKELMDRPGSAGDMKANLLGTGLGAAFVFTFK